MSLDLEQYFRLGKTSEDVPITDELFTTIRTAPDSKTTNISGGRVIFKLPTNGMITKESVIVFQPYKTRAYAPRTCLNPINGILGAIKRCTFKLNGKVLQDLELPSYNQTAKFYATHSPQGIVDYHQFLYGLGFQTCVDTASGAEELVFGYSASQLNTRAGQDIGKFIVNDNINNCRKYSIPLTALGVSFLTQQNIPAFMFKSGTMTIEIEFHEDCREYVISDGNTNDDNAIESDTVKINLDSCELVTTHILLSEQTEKAQMQTLLETKAGMQFPFVDEYLVRGTYQKGALGANQDNQYRINVQNRQLHKLLMAWKSSTITENNPVAGRAVYAANQASNSPGDIESLQVKMNGFNVFQIPISSPVMLYYLTSLWNNGSALQISPLQYRYDSYIANMGDGVVDVASAYERAMFGRMFYLGLDFTNGNVDGLGLPVPYASGVMQKTALDIDMTWSAVAVADQSLPNQTGAADELLTYLSVAKLLTVMKDGLVNITF
jgi:hypothetical protein